MAGMGKRMRPHTLTIPKPLIPIAGKPIIQHLVEDLSKVCKEKIEEIAFVTGFFGDDVEQDLLRIAKNAGSKGKIFYQENALGTAHAVLCAEKILEGKIIVAFADTLFKANFAIDDSYDGTVWVHKVSNPSAFGVVKINNENIITDFIEKPKTFVSDLAIIGIYYFKDGENLKKELQHLVNSNIQKEGEFQLTDALQNMTKNGKKLTVGKIDEWLDCGNKNATVYTNQRILGLKKNENLVSKNIIVNNSLIIKPCYIGEEVELANSIIGPYVSIGNGTKISNSLIANSIIQENAVIENANIDNSMIGSYVEYQGNRNNLNIGDYTSITQDL